jgi:hypothetical protein
MLNNTTTLEYNRVYRIVEKGLYPNRCLGTVDDKVIRMTHEILRVFGENASQSHNQRLSIRKGECQS